MPLLLERNLPSNNITSDLTVHMHRCAIEESDRCYGGVSADYTNKRQGFFPTFLGISAGSLDLEGLKDSTY